MALREKLEVIVDANVGGFVHGMDRAAAAADKGLGKTDDRLQVMAGRFTTWGAAAAGAGAVAAVGLGKLAMMAADAERQQLKLTNSIANSSNKFNANGSALRDQASALQQVTAAEDDAIVGAQAMLVQFGLTEDQVKQMTPLVVDLSRKMGLDLDAAAKAVGRSATGSTTALKRMGIDVNALGEGATSAEKTVSALSRAVGGFAEAEGQTFAGQLQIIKNQLSEIGEGLGGGVLDIVKPMTDLALSINRVDPEALNALGRIGAIGAAATVAGGGFLFLAGQAANARQVLTTVGADGSRSLNRMGSAAAVAGKALGAITVGVALYEVGQALDRAAQDAVAFDAAMARLQGGGDPLQSVIDQAEALRGPLDGLRDAGNNVLDWVNGNTGAWETATVTLNDHRVAIDDVREAIEATGKSNPALAVQQINAVLDELPKKGGPAIEDLRGRLLELRGNYRDIIDPANQAGSAITMTGEAAVAAAGGFSTIVDEAGEVKSALEQLTDAVSAGLDPVFATTKALQDQAQSKIDVVEATAELAQLERDGKKNTEEYAAAQQKLADANRGQVSAALDVQQAVAGLATEVAKNPALFDAASAALDNWVASGQITAEQAQIVRTDILNAVAAAQTADKTRAQMEIKANVANALVNIQAAVDRATAAASGDYTLVIRASTSGVIAALNTVQTIAITTANVVNSLQADGSVRVPSFAAGGMLPNQAVIQPATGGLVQWAEPETMGEAFIPLAPAKRKRSKDIWWETGRRLGVVQMAAGGFTADTLWGAIAESQKNQFDLAFDSLPPALQLANLRDQLAQLHPFSDEWTRVMRDIMRREQDVAESALDAQRDRADNEWAWNYERAKVEDRIILATQKRDSFQQWTDEWVRWAEELEQLQADAKEQLTPRANASGGRSGGQAPFYLTVNVNAEGLVTDPQEVGRQVVGAIRSYETANGTGWRA